VNVKNLYPTDSCLTHLVHDLSADGGTFPTILFCKLLAEQGQMPVITWTLCACMKWQLKGGAC